MRSPFPTPVLLAPLALVAGCAGTPEQPDFDFDADLVERQAQVDRMVIREEIP